MSVRVCVRCGGPVKFVGGITTPYECPTCGATDAKAPVIHEETSNG